MVKNSYFELLGQSNTGAYVYFLTKQDMLIRTFKVGQVGNAMEQLAPIDFWVGLFKSAKTSVSITKEARSNFYSMVSESVKIMPLFNETNSLLSGIWRDNDSAVLNNGDQQYGKQSGHLQYLRDNTIRISEHNLIDFDSNKIILALENINMPSLDKCLLQGWIVCSILSGFLRHRPHMWVVGETSSGKTDIILGSLIKPLISNAGMFTTLTASIASIKDEQNRRGRPLIVDETDLVSEKSKYNISELLALSRITCSGEGIDSKKLPNGSTSMRLYKFCICLISIFQPTLEPQDKNRFIPINLFKGKMIDISKIQNLITNDFGDSFRWWCFKNAINIENNIKKVSLSLKNIGVDGRTCDLYATVIGAYQILHKVNDEKINTLLIKIKEYKVELNNNGSMFKDFFERILLCKLDRQLNFNVGSLLNEDLYANSGALKKAGESVGMQFRPEGHHNAGLNIHVGCSIIEDLVKLSFPSLSQGRWVSFLMQNSEVKDANRVVYGKTRLNSIHVSIKFLKDYFDFSEEETSNTQQNLIEEYN